MRTARIGRGSPNTINPLLDAWWKRLASRLDAGPHALHRIPESVAQITEVLWLKALDAARERARAEERTTRGQLERDRREVDLRGHVLSLREAEFEDRLKERERTIAMLEEQVAALTRLLQTEQANRAAAERRIVVLASSLREVEARTALLFSRLAERTTKPRRGTTPARRRADKPVGHPRKITAKPVRARPTANQKARRNRRPGRR